MASSSNQQGLLIMIAACIVAPGAYFYLTDFSPGAIEVPQWFQDPVGPHTGDMPSISVTENDKIILLYTRFFSYVYWGFKKPGREAFKSCSYKNCLLTNNKKDMTKASVVLFHCRNRFGGMPNWRRRNQTLAMYCAEASSNSPVDKFDFRVNMTATYRLDSDLYTPYYRVYPREKPSRGPYVPHMGFAQKNKSIAWVVSHCRTKSKREVYAKELRKHIDLDVFGHCGKLSCSKSNATQCFQNIARKYKFYLSFEHSMCKDYVTEKFYRTLQFDIVPIVLGDGNYSAIAPPSSYIDVKDFSSPKRLADYLKYLSANQTAYESYLQWKSRYTVKRHSIGGLMCDLCKVANEGTFHRAPYGVSDWWSKDTCDHSYVPNILGLPT